MDLSRWLLRIRTAVLAVLFIVAGNIILNEDVEAKQEELSRSLIRFHVRANSDSEEDQQLKLLVKDAVVCYMEELLEDSSDVQESARRIQVHMEDILAVAMEVIHENGYDYDLEGYMTKEKFPLKVYGDVALPPGEYTAFRIDIGEAEGKNWWCVLYPPLCFVDITYGVVPKESKEEMEKIVGEEAFRLTEDCTVEFKYLTFLNPWLEDFNQ
ncbi:MAG: stage II sporulation protein R [Lachnospiraceae bacterium]